MRFSSWSIGGGTVDQLYIPLRRVLRGFMGVCPTSPHVLCGSGEGIRPCPSNVVFCGECSASMGSGAFATLLRAVRSLSVRPEQELGSHCRHQDLQHVLERFAAECEAAGMRISTSKSEAMVLDRKRVVCPLRVSGEVLPQVEEFKYLGVLFTSEGKMEREIDRRIGAASSAVMRSVYRTVVVKKELSRKAKALDLPVNLRSHLTYGHELWVMTEKDKIADTSGGKMSFLHGVAGRSLRDRRLPREVFQACPTGRRPRGRPRTRWRDYVSRLAWERLGIPPEELEEVSGVREVWASLLRLLPPRPGPGSKRMKMDGWMDGI
ncbi:hypothetical protein L3Q82_021856, partial [Scortum barcoo]